MKRRVFRFHPRFVAGIAGSSCKIRGNVLEALVFALAVYLQRTL